eukprot:CAMPEP_0197246920 /NCGR_PEP_ID=MMETSP1429-20130617/23539_1 /TAXON_ID=49237 /ORGANISM="Chaetoceros  sp., Strain UNC1202" /LENGTH=441 /DNA_ID=CAMNT_0042707695 /DNA_START=22 /DNA_END=1347 /DNA_ORIENTATION=-
MIIPNISMALLALGLGPAASFSPTFPRSSTTRSDSSLMASSGGDLTGKVVAQRYIYRFSPTKSSIKTPYTIEERQYYKVAEDRSLDPFGDRCFILRGGEKTDDEVEPPEESIKKNGMPRAYTRIGPALQSIKDMKENEDDELGATVWESSYVMALYCMENPDIITGRGLEVGCGVGVGGILATVGAGLASGSTEEKDSQKYQSIEDIASAPVESDDTEGTLMAPVPANLSKICMTDSHENLLNKCLDNLGAAKFPINKAEVLALDWNRRVPNEMKDKFDFIIGCDCAYYFPLVNPLARTVAYSLKSSPYDRKKNEQMIRGQFLHIGPAHRESIDELKRKLARGYRMNTRMKDIVLERIDLVPLILDSLDDEETQLKEEIEGDSGGFVEYQNMDASKYTALISSHNEEYDGFNGDYFFPAETGSEGSYGGSGQEVDYGTETA